MASAKALNFVQVGMTLVQNVAGDLEKDSIVSIRTQQTWYLFLYITSFSAAIF